MKKDNKTICSYCGKRFNFDTMKYGLCSDCYEMVMKYGLCSDCYEMVCVKIVMVGLAMIYYENRIDYKKELNDFYNYLNN